MKASAILMSFLFGYPFVPEADENGSDTPEEPPPSREPTIRRKASAPETPKVELYHSPLVEAHEPRRRRLR